MRSRHPEHERMKGARVGQRRVVVVGGTQDFGRAIARHLSNIGHQVIALGPVDGAAMDGEAIAVDLDQISSLPEALKTAADRLGGIDALVNAVDSDDPADLSEVSPEQWQQALDRNLKLPFFAIKAATAHMKDKGGIIVNFTSVRGSVAAAGQVAYSATKAGISALTREIATDLGRYGIKCNSLMLPDPLAPTLTNTSITAEDVVEAVAFLITEGAYHALDAFDLPLDGGSSMLLEPVDGWNPVARDPLADQVAVVTGGSSGLGAAAARHLAGKGVRVAVVDVLDEEGTQLAEELKMDSDAEFFHCDIGDRANIAEVVQAIEERFGRIDILLNSAAITSRTRVPEISEDLWDRFMDIDLKGTFYMAMDCARRMTRVGGGRIINFSSMLSTLSHGRHTLYGGAKEAVNGMTRALAAALKPEGIQVFSVLPAYVITPMAAFRLTDEEWIKRNYLQSLSKVLLYPEHVNDVFTYLATSRSEAHTGHKIHVDTGYLNFRYKAIPWKEDSNDDREDCK